jgi:hypothetical protein
MLRFGELIQRIQQFQHSHVFFLAENTVIKNDKNKPLEEGDLELIKKAFGISWSVDLDAKDFSPVRRNRSFFTNIPVETVVADSFDDENAVSCLRDGYKHGAHFCEEKMVVRSNCFMAGTSRVDDDRMRVFKKVGGGKYLERTMKTQEREEMMGYPTGYVEKPGMCIR